METKKSEVAVVPAPNIVRTTLQIRGTAPLVIHRFSKKAELMAKMSAPKEKAKKAERPPRDYQAELMAARHLSQEGWDGIPCGAFRAAMIAACRTVGLVMTQAKMAVWVKADGFDAAEGTPLVKIVADEPERSEMNARNDSGGVDIRVRPMWRSWGANVTIEFDADMISASSVVNLLSRAGLQVGVGEGRPFSRESCGLGWGTFEVVSDKGGAA